LIERLYRVRGRRRKREFNNIPNSKRKRSISKNEGLTKTIAVNGAIEVLPPPLKDRLKVEIFEKRLPAKPLIERVFWTGAKLKKCWLNSEIKSIY
jgi:hypothetical protein